MRPIRTRARLLARRDKLICELWSTFASLSKELGDDMSDADADIFFKIANHEALQRKLD